MAERCRRCTYSRSMEQSYPRACVVCGEKEIIHTIRLPLELPISPVRSPEEDRELFVSNIIETIEDALNFYAGNTESSSCACQNTYSAETALLAFKELKKLYKIGQ